MNKQIIKVNDHHSIDGRVSLELEKRGFTEWVSRGVYGKVFANPDKPNQVCKIGSVKHNSPYLNFVNEFLSLKGNIFVPKIFAYRVYESNKNHEHDMFLIVMEKLELIEDNVLFDYSCKMLEELANLIFESPKPFKSEFIKLVKHLNPLSHTSNILIDQLWDALNCVLKAAKRCDEFYFTNGVDFHSKNLMYRTSTNSIVIVDPLR